MKSFPQCHSCCIQDKYKLWHIFFFTLTFQFWEKIVVHDCIGVAEKVIPMPGIMDLSQFPSTAISPKDWNQKVDVGKEVRKSE